MSSRKVTSPVGEEIEIVTDRDWALTAGVNVQSLVLWEGSKQFAVRELWEYGPVIDASGFSSSVLYDRITTHYSSVDLRFTQGMFAAMMKRPVNLAAFDRITAGKRTYRIDLIALPERWYGKLMDDIASESLYPATPLNDTAPAIDTPELMVPNKEISAEQFEAIIMPEPDIEPEPVLDIEISRQVAMQLLTTVVEIISTGNATDANQEVRRIQNELTHSQGLLAQRLEENERFRKQLRDTGDELHSVKSERDGLRQRLRQTEANLSAALRGETSQVVATEVMKQVNSFLRETPRPKGE